MMATLVDHALQYAGRGWAVFQLSAYKVPFKGSHGHLDATTDPATIEGWWRERPLANIGLACGDLVVLDADGPGGLDQLKALGERAGGLPRTLVTRTSRGFHFFYKAPPGLVIRTRNAPRTVKGGDGLDIKGHGGYVVLAPSTNAKTGFQYHWANNEPIATMTVGMFREIEALRGKTGVNALSGGKGANRQQAPVSDSFALGEIPEWVRGRAVRTTSTLTATLTRAELQDFLQALKKIDAGCSYDKWFEYGAAIHDYDPSPNGLIIFKKWSLTSRYEHHRESVDIQCERLWTEYGKPKPGKVLITKASIYAAALQADTPKTVDEATGKIKAENDLIPPVEGNGNNSGTVNGNRAAAALPSIFTPAAQGTAIRFPDIDRHGVPKPTCRNARVAIAGLGIDCEHDVFHGRMRVGGQPIEQWAGELSDDAVQMIRVLIERTYRFDPGLTNAHDAAVQECLQNGYDPVLDYLDGLAWDRQPRLGGWLSQYMGAEASPLTQAVGGLLLVAAVRRVRAPGTKFDQITVLESPEGFGKSSALELMAGQENFSDQSILTLDDKAQQEAIQGVMIYEIADLAGMSRADVEKVKAFASRKVDRARPAYGRARVDRPRRCIFVATTNNDTYLKSQTGNRRFWPVRVGRINLEALARDRDQLWAEAVAIEKSGIALGLPERFWKEAAEVQDSRRDHDPWDSIIETLEGKVFEGWSADGPYQGERVFSRDLYEIHLKMPIERLSDVTAKRIAYAMRRHGWEGPKTIRDGKKVRKGFVRVTPANE